MTTLTDSTMHSVPANMAPIRAKFLAYEIVLNFISFMTSLTVGVSVPVMFGSMPAVNRPKAPPSRPPGGQEHQHI